MATDAENLATIRSNILATLATESANPKPTYSIAGQNVDWNGYRNSLMQQLKDINAQMDAISGPWEVAVQGLP